MTSRKPWLFATTALLASQPALAGEQVLFAAAPDWVQSVPVDPAISLDAELPVHVLLNDVQTLLAPGAASTYNSIAIRINNPQGLSAGNLSLAWRGDTDDLTVHHVRIRRAGEVIDVLDEGQTFTVLRREQSLEMATLTGVLTANMFPAGLEVGDTLEIAFTVDQRNPVLPEATETAFGPFNGPLGKVHVRVNWPEDMDVELKSTRGLPALERGSKGGLSFAEFSLSQPDQLLLPSGAPGRYALVRMLEATSFDSWSDLAEQFVPLYAEASRIPASGKLREEVDKIAAATQDPVKRAELALALVQDKVRYVALAMGAGGLMPADTETTWSRRYGDCKAKTALLIGVLGELGIAAEPVLVNSVLGDALSGLLPRAAAFDHVLVRTRIDGREYYMDGTGTGDTSLDRLQVPFYSWGLPVAAGAALVPMVPAALPWPTEETVVRIDASGGVHAAAPVTAEVIYRGDDAIGMNAVMSQLAGDARRQAMEQFWQSELDDAKPENVAFAFDSATGLARMTMDGTTELDWDGTFFEPSGMRVGYDPDFSRQPGPDAEAPFALGHPFYNRQRYEITLPRGFSAAQIDGEEVDTTLAGIEYRREVALENGVFTATRTTRSIAPELAYDDAIAAESALKSLREKRLFLRLPSGYRASDDDIGALSQIDAAGVVEIRRRAYELFEAGAFAAALPLLEKATELDPNDAWTWANRALALANMNRLDEAETAYEKALAISPTYSIAFNARGAVALQRQDYATAIEAYRASWDADQENSWALQKLGDAYYLQGNYQESLAIGEQLLERFPDLILGYTTKAYSLVKLGREQEADTVLQAALKAQPDNEVRKAMISEVYLMLDMEDQSDALLADTIDGSDNPAFLVQRAARRETGEYKEKMADLNAALAIDPDMVPALIMRSDEFWADEEYAKALADIDRALELEPRSLNALQSKARILLEQGRRTDAMPVITRMMELVEGNAVGMAVTSQYLRQAGKEKEADDLLERAHSIAPDNRMVNNIRNRS